MTPKSTQHPIAIVGIGARFPQAPDAETFWGNIVAGKTAFADVPEDRWNHSIFFSANQRDVDKAWVSKGSFIDSYREFAPMHYGIAPRRLEVMDPQQRLLIESTRVALQDAGYERRDFERKRTGVFVGLSIAEFQQVTNARLFAMRLAAGDFGAAPGSEALREALLELTSNVVPIRAFTLSGSLTALAAAAIAQTFDLGGPAYTMDSACASASIAVHDAVTQLRSGAIDGAVAGGAYLNLAPDNLVAFTKIGAISPSGACRPFDHRADGFVQSDGVAMLYLKRLEDAIAADDRIYAVIRGSGVNNDGRGEGPMTPRKEGQKAVLQTAYADAGFAIDRVSYFEAHGTATSIGDPVEVAALGESLVEAGASSPTPIGSVKGNIGHAMSAAGIAGLVKAIKVLEHRTVPPQPGFESPHPKLGIDRYPLTVPTAATELEPRGDGPLTVAVSSFGFGGTNSHLVLEEAPTVVRHRRVSRPIGVDLDAPERKAAGDAPQPEAIVVSGPTPALLAEHLRALRDAIAEGSAREASLADIAYTLNARRKHERYRAVVGARDAAHLVGALGQAAEGLAAATDPVMPLRVARDVTVYDAGEYDAEPPKVCLLFPGQGAQRVGLLGDVKSRFARFSTHFDQFSAAADRTLPRPLRSYLYPERVESDADRAAAEEALKATEICQPAMAALGLATAAFLRDLGLDPAVSLGHSLGEFAALASAGVLQPEDAVRLVTLRGSAMRALPLADTGTMAAVMADEATVRAAVEGMDGVWVANVNHPRQVVVSGTTPGVTHAVEALTAQGLEVKPLEVSHAFHSPLVEGISDTLQGLLSSLEFGAPEHVAASGIDAEPYSGDAARTQRILLDHATSPVLFSRGLEQAKAAGATVFVQAGAGNVLTNLARATLGRNEIIGIELAGLEPDDGFGMMHGLCTLAALGLSIDLEVAYEGEARRVVTLPETPLERSEFWPVKANQHPKAEITIPLARAEDTRLVDVAGTEPATSPDAPAGDSARDRGLVELFSRQNQILTRTAEIIATQNRLLLGEGGEAAPEGLATLEAQIAGLMQEPTAPAEAKPAAPAPTPAAIDDVVVLEPEEDPAEVEARILEVVAKISAFPQGSLRLDQRLVDELGFDSLMVADLSAALQGAFPGLGNLPPTLFDLKTTVADLARHVTEALRAPATTKAALEVPTGPLMRYRVVPVERPRGDYARTDVKGQTWLVTEDGSELTSDVSADLAARGANLIRVRFTQDGVAAPAQLSRTTLNLWPESFVEGLPAALREAGVEVHGVVHAASLSLSDAADFVNPVDLLHPLAAQLSPAVFITLAGMGGRLGLERSPTLSRNLLQGTLTGYTKALAKERPRAVVRTLDLDPQGPPKATASWVVDEIVGGDRSPEVGYDGRRWLPELAETSAAEPVRKLGDDDVVLVTGGAGEIGALTARWAASQAPKAVLLLGRRVQTEPIAKLCVELKALGTEVRYLSADLNDKEGFRAALRPAVDAYGPVTVVFHAAGLIEDATVDNKSLESVHRVMDVKVRGLQTVLRSCPKLRDVVLYSSWAGRFGNAGQADYAAANELLDRIAVVGAGAARVVSLVWPPWSSTQMVQSIPEAIRAAMLAEGVTFVDDEEGVAALQATFEGAARGIEVVGRGLVARLVEAKHVEGFSLGRHPYLDDHRLEGRPVVPLASAADLMGWAFRETTGRVGPLVLDELDLVRGLAADDIGAVRVQGRRGLDGVTEASLEVRVPTDKDPAGLLAYRARATNRRIELDAPPSLGGEARALPVDLETFYGAQTFHGPRFHGIEAIDRMTSEGIEGRVRGAPIATWLPDSGRSQWTADPLVLDASFQLAGYWLFQQHGKAGYPVGFSQLELTQPFGTEPVGVRVVLGATDETSFSGDIYYFDANGSQVGKLTGIRGRFAELSVSTEAAAEAAPAPADEVPVEIPEESYRVGAFPEVVELDQRFQMAELMGLKNPYFSLHTGTARDTSLVDGVEMLNYSSYNYLGFSGHPQVVEAAQKAIGDFGTSVSASRVASGERPVHRELEQGIAEHVGVEAALVFVSGHATNVTTVGHVMGREDLILHDSLIHDSILQGIYLSGATRRPFPHNDLDALERTLQQIRGSYRRVLICAEGIYSMDGDICDLPRLVELKKRYKTLLMIDEAHSIGVLGEAGCGIAGYAGVDPNDVDIWMGTLSKSFASCGGYIAGSADLIRYLKYTAPGFVYSAGIPPPNAAAALESLRLMHAHPEVVEQCRSRSRFFMERARSKGIDTGDAIGAAVVPAIIGNSLICMRLSERLLARKINVQPIVYPAVEDEKARLRFFISATHTEEQLAHTVDVLVEELAKVRAEAEGGEPRASL